MGEYCYYGTFTTQLDAVKLIRSRQNGWRSITPPKEFMDKVFIFEKKTEDMNTGDICEVVPYTGTETILPIEEFK